MPGVRKKATIAIRKYRRGIPWTSWDNLAEWIQADQQKRYGKKYTLEECETAMDNMRIVSDAARKARNFADIIIQHNPDTNRWASYETQADLAIQSAKGTLKEGGYAEIAADITPRSRARMIATIAEMLPGEHSERVFNVWKANRYITFYAKKNGYSDVWGGWLGGWRAMPPAKDERPLMQSGTRLAQYCELVKGINDARHHWKEPLQQSEFLRRLDERIVETGFELEVKECETRWEALDALRNRMWTITKIEDAKPIIAIRQSDGSSLISDRSLAFEAERIADLPVMRFEFDEDNSYCEWYIGNREISQDVIYEIISGMPVLDANGAHVWLSNLVGFEFNTLQALNAFDQDCENVYAFLFSSDSDGPGKWRGIDYNTEAEIEARRIRKEQREAAEKAETEKKAKDEAVRKEQERIERDRKRDEERREKEATLKAESDRRSEIARVVNAVRSSNIYAISNLSSIAGCAFELKKPLEKLRSDLRLYSDNNEDAAEGVIALLQESGLAWWENQAA